MRTQEEKTRRRSLGLIEMEMGGIYENDGLMDVFHEGHYEIPLGVTAIDFGKFREKSMTSVSIPSSVKTIGGHAFMECKKLQFVVIPRSVISIGDHAFYACESLAYVIIPQSLISISPYTFYECTNLTDVLIPEGVDFIGDGAFMNCKSLTSMVIPQTVTSICNYAFKDCESLSSVVIPQNVTSLGDEVFGGCGKLTSIVIGGSNDKEYYRILQMLPQNLQDIAKNTRNKSQFINKAVLTKELAKHPGFFAGTLSDVVPTIISNLVELHLQEVNEHALADAIQSGKNTGI